MPSAPASQPASRLLIVEDEPAMRMALEDCLRAEGYRVFTADNGRTGLDKAVAEKPDLIVLDIMLPQLNGFHLCAELRRIGRHEPILMLTAKGQVQDRVIGLDAGADDYLVKPFSTDELLARIRALVRRTRRQTRMTRTLTLGPVRVDFVHQRAWRGRKELHLTAKEFAVLRLLVDAGGEPVTREQFLDVVWGYATFPTTRTVDTHIATLRAKLEPDPDRPRWLKTVHHVGYRLDLPKE
jgi:DNA-binding response OmpR family regulator